MRISSRVCEHWEGLGVLENSSTSFQPRVSPVFRSFATLKKWAPRGDEFIIVAMTISMCSGIFGPPITGCLIQD